MYMMYLPCSALFLVPFFLMQISSAFNFVRTGSQYSVKMSEQKKYPLSQPHYNRNKMNERHNLTEEQPLHVRDQVIRRSYPISKPRSFYEDYIKILNSKNSTIQTREILQQGQYNKKPGDQKKSPEEEEEERTVFSLNQLIDMLSGNFNETDDNDIDDLVIKNAMQNNPKIRVKRVPYINIFTNKETDDDDDNSDDFGDSFSKSFNNRDKKSENFEVITKTQIKFNDIGGYDKIKSELMQCVDILTNHQKYKNYNVRVPKGLILEGPPGNGKTLLAKAFAGEAHVGFIPVSGAEFQEKYVGVGSSRVRELFTLAKKNAPCIIFIDEIDAIGRKRSSDGESSANERDNTLNELLVALDGFKSTSGVFLIGATNRADLLDPALTRPGRIDKRIFIGPPDSSTREAILDIHTTGKPYDESIIIKDMVDLTMGLSAAQIENLVNEAMLNALRENRTVMNSMDIDHIMNKMMAGWQPTDHQFTSDIIDHITIHEMGHAVMGLLSKHHSKMTKVIINLSSPKSPGYTVFEGSTSTIYTREALFEHLAILLAGRIAEEVFYGVSVTTGAINDFEEAFKLAEKMIVFYGMGKKVIYPNMSEKYKEIIDNEVQSLINEAYNYAEFMLQNSRGLILEGAEILKTQKVLRAETLMELLNNKYPEVNNLKYTQ